MKTTAFAFITLIVGSLASPTIFLNRGKAQDALSDERIVTGQIIQAIENIARQIREAGLDPLLVNRIFEAELPVPVIFSVRAVIDELVFTGLSNIVVTSMNFSILTNRLTFDIVLPNLSLSVGNSDVSVILFGEERTGSLSGSLNVNRIRMVGDIRVQVGIISGISIRSLSLQFSLGGIQSNLNINVLGTDLSEKVNTYLGTTIPNTLNEFSSEINELIEAIAWMLINEILGFSGLLM